MDPAMKRSNKKAIAVSSSGFLLFVAYYGSFLPIRKEEMSMHAEEKIKAANSINDVVDILSAPLNQASPIGQEELIIRSAEVVGVLTDKYGARRASIIPPLVAFLKRYYDPYLAAGRIAKSSRGLYVIGNVNLHAYGFLHEQQYLEAARRYFELGLANCPTRPEFISSLFEIYVTEGDLYGARKMGALMVTYWPQDSEGRARVAQTLAALEQRAR
jgi:hypothetical protein